MTHVLGNIKEIDMTNSILDSVKEFNGVLDEDKKDTTAMYARINAERRKKFNTKG